VRPPKDSAEQTPSRWKAGSQEVELKAELIQDKDDPNAYRVEAIDSDGGVEVAVFSGPNALDRAVHFAAAVPGAYYEEFGDPQGLTGWARRPAL
jgi:hypothetical protein